MIAGYHTGGLLHHDLPTAIKELAHLGYGCIAIRPHAGSLHPDLPNFAAQVLRVADAIARTGMQAVLDLDGLFLQDPFIERVPSLIAADQRACESARGWIEQWVTIGEEIGASLVTFSSGAGESSDFVGDEENLERLTEQLNQLIAATADRKPTLAIRPRAHDVIGSVVQFERLQMWLGESAGSIGLAADIGEMMAASELPVSDRLKRNRDSLKCVYLCDHQSGVAGDQRVGCGDVALHRIVESLVRDGFSGPGIVRIEGHSELGLTPAREAIAVFDR